jgi:hypothetical protein
MFPKFRCRVTGTSRFLHSAHFEEVPDFDAADHVKVVSLPGKAGKDEFEAFVRSFAGFPVASHRVLISCTGL